MCTKMAEELLEACLFLMVDKKYIKIEQIMHINRDFMLNFGKKHAKTKDR